MMGEIILTYLKASFMPILYNPSDISLKKLQTALKPPVSENNDIHKIKF